MYNMLKEIVNLLREILYEVRHINEMLTEEKEKEHVVLIKNNVNQISNNQRTKK